MRKKKDEIELPKASKPSGNAVAMREAAETALMVIRGIINGTIARTNNSVFDCRDKLKSALSAPVRNCDRFKTADEAWNAYDEWVESFRVKRGMPPYNVFGWLFAPAAERKGGSE